MISIVLDNRSTLEQLKWLALPPKKQQRLIQRAANEIKKVSARNITRQQTPDGKTWAPRKQGKRKMLLGLRQKIVVVEKAGQGTAELRFRGGNYGAHPGVVAGTHQRGHTYKTTASQQAKKLARPTQGDAKASRAQAKTLRQLGYKRPGKRKGQYRSASLGWITDNLGYAQAGLLIKQLKGKPVKTSWAIPLPARAFLGATKAQREQAFARALQGINYGWDVNKQDMRN
ncbi:Phage virion morphogenesis family protein [compost metagenome]